MNKLAFLQVDPVDAPAPRSPLAAEVLAAGDDPAVGLPRCRETVGFADLSHLGAFELQGRAEEIAAAVPSRDGGQGPLATLDGDAWWCPVTPRRALVVDAVDAAEVNRAAVESFRGYVLDVGAATAAIGIAGPLAREAIARFCALDLRASSAPPSAFRPGSIARTAGYVLCDAPDSYVLMFGAAYASYLWEVVADSADHLGGGPVGVGSLIGARHASGGGLDA